jgi:opacity protein-like surface antigen
MSRRNIAVVLLISLAFCLPAAAQSAEVAVLGGGQFPQGSGAFTFERSPAVQGNLAVRVAHVPLLAAYLEVPVTFGLNSSVMSALGNPTAIPRNYNALYVTPGLKIKFAPISPISPYLVGGVGFARLQGSATLENGATNPARTRNTEVFDFGGGLDFKIAPFLSFRAEVRDYYVGLPNGVGLSGRQHTLLPMGGLVLRF